MFDFFLGPVIVVIEYVIHDEVLPLFEYLLGHIDQGAQLGHVLLVSLAVVLKVLEVLTNTRVVEDFIADLGPPESHHVDLELWIGCLNQAHVHLFALAHIGPSPG